MDTVIIERPYGSARFYDDKNRSMQLSADSIAKGKGLRDEIEKISDLEIGPFFQGEEINWKELAASCNVYRSQIKKSSLEKRIEKEIMSVPSNRGILLLGEYAGSGTTTIMKRLGFNIAKKHICPVVYLHRIDANTWKILEDFYHYCNKQKFLILMDNVSPISEKFQELYGILQSRGVHNVHRIVKVNWDRLKLLLNRDSMRQLIMIKADYYDEKLVNRIVPRNYCISEILLQSKAYDFPQRVFKILTENLSIREGEKVEEDLLFNIVRSKELHNS